MLVNNNPAVYCLFMLVHRGVTMLTNTSFDFNKELVNVDININ